MSRITEYLQQSMCNWRHDIHRHPELGFEEHLTAKKVASLLQEWGIETHTGIGGTGIVGVIKRGTGSRMLGIRADMDALAIEENNTFDHCSQHAGKMHACGHDGHTAMLLGAACHLAKHGDFDGTVVLIFQPAEEHGKGAKSMIADGLFERFPVQDIYAIHNFPSVPLNNFIVKKGPVMASEDNFEILIEGVGHHAAMPHKGVDPIVVASQIVLALQTIVSRRINPSEKAVISVTEFITDGTVNVVPNQVILKGDTRSFLPEVQQQIKDNMQVMAESICAANGISCQFTYTSVFDSTINTSKEADKAATVALALVGEEHVSTAFEPPMTSEDFAFMLQAKPGCYVLLGNDGDGPGGCGLHNPNYDFNDGILTTGADFWVKLVESELVPGC
ncbi:MAG: amidohydrolase [Oceanospirillaceae bacterium]|jgi:amidohydrolase